MVHDFNCVVAGAGVIGLAVARALARAGHSVLVLEAGAAAGLETSSRNSEVIHAGIYYPAGSLKARLCVEGRKLLYAYCAEAGVPTRQLGKLIVATGPAEEAKLQSIAALAKANGVDDLVWLDAAGARELEPEVVCTRALYSPSTGIVEGRALMLALQGEAEAHGAGFAFKSRCVAARRADTGFIVTVEDESGAATDISCAMVVNAAGHGAHALARATEGLPHDSLPPRFLAKGSYCSVTGAAPFRHLVYPTPVAGALGIHATLDLAGAVRFGPDIRWVERLDYSLPEGLPEAFAAAVEQYWPGVRSRDLLPTYCGVRPKIHGPAQAAADFCIMGPADHGVPGLVNLFGMESPGLTSSLAVAWHVMGLLSHASVP